MKFSPELYIQQGHESAGHKKNGIIINKDKGKWKSLVNQTIGNTIIKSPLHWFGNLMLRSFETYDSDFSLTTLKRVIISKESGVVKMIEKKKRGKVKKKELIGKDLREDPALRRWNWIHKADPKLLGANAPWVKLSKGCNRLLCFNYPTLKWLTSKKQFRTLIVGLGRADQLQTKNWVWKFMHYFTEIIEFFDSIWYQWYHKNLNLHCTYQRISIGTICQLFWFIVQEIENMQLWISNISDHCAIWG